MCVALVHTRGAYYIHIHGALHLEIAPPLAMDSRVSLLTPAFVLSKTESRKGARLFHARFARKAHDADTQAEGIMAVNN